MKQINLDTWRLATGIWARAQRDGQTIGRPALKKLLNISDRDAGYLLFALQHRDIINCKPQIIETDTDLIELAIGDIHIPFQDDAAISVALDFAEAQGVNLITINGDLLDFYQISSFVKNPLRSKRLFEEIGQAKAFLAELRERFPEARIILKEGNHEARLQKYILEKAPQLAELVESLLPEKLGLKELGIEYIVEPFRIGQLWHLHGHEKPSGSFNVEYITNVIMNYVLDHFIVFHHHRNQTKNFKRLGDRWLIAASIGYLAGSMDYSQINKWNQGFAIVRYQANGEFRLEPHSIINGEFF